MTETVLLLVVFLAGVAVGWLTKIPGFRRYYFEVAENRKAIKVVEDKIRERMAADYASRIKAIEKATEIMDRLEASRNGRGAV